MRQLQGDQIIASLGAWSENILPEIAGVDQIADDVATEHLDFLLEHRELAPESMDAALINAKGFGGNNATASHSEPACHSQDADQTPWKEDPGRIHDSQ